MYEKPPTDFSELFAPFPQKILDIGNTARKAIFDSIPEAKETVSGGKKVGNALYSTGQESTVVCGMQPTATFLRIFFHNWECLKQAGYCVEGSGKNARHIKIKSMSDFNDFDIQLMLALVIK